MSVDGGARLRLQMHLPAPGAQVLHHPPSGPLSDLGQHAAGRLEQMEATSDRRLSGYRRRSVQGVDTAIRRVPSGAVTT
jgi:hypothetical protein